jgi:hypothetical protein
MYSVQRRGNVTLIALAILIALAYIIPYGFLADVTAWRGAFYSGPSLGLPPSRSSFD